MQAALCSIANAHARSVDPLPFCLCKNERVYDTNVCRKIPQMVFSVIPETPWSQKRHGERACDFCHSAILAKMGSQSCRRSLSNFDACDFAFQGYMSQQRADPGLQRSPMAPKIPTDVRGALAQAKRVLTCCMRLKTSKILFNEPVDPVALGLDDYRDKVKTPMDFGTIMARLQDGEKVEWKKCYYTSPGKVLRDVKLVFDNCFAYNDGPGDEVTRELCSEVKANFEKRWREASLPLEPAEQNSPLPSGPRRDTARRVDG